MNIQYAQLRSALILGGITVSWSFLLTQFINEFTICGTLWQLGSCGVRNPLLAPCFYGSVAFLAAFIWSMYLQNHPSVTSEKWLSFFLLFGTAFAATVVGIELLQYCGVLGGPKVGCVQTVHPLAAPCAFGGMIFLLSYLASLRSQRR